MLALALAAVGACEAPIWTTAVELGGRRGGTAAGICNTGGNAGGLLAPIVTPLVSNWVSARFELDANAATLRARWSDGPAGSRSRQDEDGVRPAEAEGVAHAVAGPHPTEPPRHGVEGDQRVE